MKPPRRRGIGLAGRLFAAQTLTALVGAATLWLVATAIGPGIFHQHLREAAAHVGAATSKHVEEAFTSASAISILVALISSLAAALAISAYVSRRIAGPVARLAIAARDVAAGRYDTVVGDSSLGAEFATLTESFNAMAARLEMTETTRRRLLADLAHEMRTPVSTLDAYLEGLEDGVVTVDAETVSLLRTQTQRLARLAEDIAAVSSAEEHQLELDRHRIDVSTLVTTAVDTVRDHFERCGVAVTAEVDELVPAVEADGGRLEQVLGNLLDNALRHTPPGGRVVVSARGVRNGAAVEIAVADTGDGISAQHLPHLFERFYRVDRARDRSHGGSGIGLAIVKALVEAHGGFVAAASAGPGQGATFTLTLPADVSVAVGADQRVSRP